MADITRNPHPNTVAFACLEDSVAILIADVIHAIYSILNWRQSSKSFLIEILARLGEEGKFECSHLNFAEILFPSLDETARKVKVGRWSKKLFEDLRDSLFLAVIIVPRRTGKSEGGKYYGLPTLYKRGKFWKLFRAVQDAAIECDLLNLPLRNRRQKVRAIVEAYLNKVGAKRIVREKKEKEKSEKEKSASLPCKCDCASCQKCLTSASAKNGFRIEHLRHLPNENFNVDLEAFGERFYQHLCELGEASDGFRFAVKHAYRELEIAVNRAREMITTENKRDARRHMKLVGGQSK
jgi:hypothetical protein